MAPEQADLERLKALLDQGTAGHTPAQIQELHGQALAWTDDIVSKGVHDRDFASGMANLLHIIKYMLRLPQLAALDAPDATPVLARPSHMLKQESECVL